MQDNYNYVCNKELSRRTAPLHAIISLFAKLFQWLAGNQTRQHFCIQNSFVIFTFHTLYDDDGASFMISLKTLPRSFSTNLTPKIGVVRPKGGRLKRPVRARFVPSVCVFWYSGSRCPAGSSG